MEWVCFIQELLHYSRSSFQLFLFCLLGAKGNALQILTFKKKNKQNQPLSVRKLYCIICDKMRLIQCWWWDETQWHKSRCSIMSWRGVLITSLVVIYENNRRDGWVSDIEVMGVVFFFLGETEKQEDALWPFHPPAVQKFNNTVF